jgi:hypothetical protein
MAKLKVTSQKQVIMCKKCPNKPLPGLKTTIFEG